MWVLEYLYLLCAILLSVYGFNSLVLTALYLWHRRRPRPLSLPADEWKPDEHPYVTVQLPIYNELHTAERLLAAVAALDYPRERLEVQVLDDSTDGTRQLVARIVERLSGQGLDVVHVTRGDRTGYKAGALAVGLARAKGEFIAVFDADFCPPASFLRQVIPHAVQPGVGCVQTRWGHVNRDYSTVTRIQALMMDGHFVVEQTARSRAGLFCSFNGTAGIWRRACIEDAGGWMGETLTEDLDLSYRAQLRGWRIEYLPDVVVPAELPAQINAFKRQQARWAQGSIQTTLKVLGPLLRSRYGWGVKLQGFLHLTAYLAHPLMLLNLLLILPTSLLLSSGQGSAAPGGSWLQVLAPWLLIAALGPPSLFAVAQVTGEAEWHRRLYALPLLMLVGVGIALNNTWAVLKALLGVRQGFLRTPKFAIRRTQDTWVDSAYALGIDPLIWGELGLAIYAFALLAVPAVPWTLAPWLLLFATGFAYTASAGLLQAYQRRRWLTMQQSGQAAQISSK